MRSEEVERMIRRLRRLIFLMCFVSAWSLLIHLRMVCGPALLSPWSPLIAAFDLMLVVWFLGQALVLSTTLEKLK